MNPIPAPPTRNIQVHYNAQVMVRKWWFHYSSLPLFLLTTSWVGFSVFGYVRYVAGTTSATNLILIVPVIIGLSLLYLSTAKTLNKTEIPITRQKLKVIHGPLPWFGSCKISCYDICSVKTQKQTTLNSAQWAQYDVVAVGRDGKERIIISHLEHEKQAIYIRDLMKGFLHLAF